MFTNAKKNENLNKFISSLKEELKLLEKGFPDHYKPLLARISPEDIKGILKWVIDKHSTYLIHLSPDHPIRIAAKKPGQSSSYPFPVTIHFTMDAEGNVQMIYDPNSKLARPKSKSILKKSAPPPKDPEVKEGETPIKQRGKGSNKEVRDTWTFHARSHILEPSVASVFKGEENLKYFHLSKKLYQPDNPLLLPTHFGAQYLGHEAEEKKPVNKAISFATRAEGNLLDFINDMETIKPDLVDIIWICYATARGLATFNANGFIYRDIKPENFLYLHNAHGISVFFNDWDYALSTEGAEKKGEAATWLYYAFDRPFFNELLKCHNNALQEFAQLKESVAAQTNFEDFMDARTGPAFEALKKYPFFDLLEFPLAIILNKKEIIPLNTPNHVKDDAWALCMVLNKLLLSFNEYQNYTPETRPPIINEIFILIRNNLLKMREERLDAQELCIEFSKLLQSLLAPTHGLSEQEIGRGILWQKFKDQLEYHQIELNDNLQPAKFHTM